MPWVRKGRTFEGFEVKDDFYNTPTWRRFRLVYIAIHPLCRLCETNGRITRATVVDHITPINQGGAKFDERNLQPLCASCHNAKSAGDRWNKIKTE